MNDNAFSLLRKSLSTNAPSPQTELMNYRITPDTDLPPLEFLFTMNGTPCFPRSELVAITGKAKSGKTLFLSIVMACAIRRNALALERISDTPIRVLWYDTEQSAQSTQQILDGRITPLSSGEHQDSPQPAETDEQIFAFNVRGIGWERRRELLGTAIEILRPDLVIVDGVKDLIADINDGTQSTMLIEDQMGLAQCYGCCIVDVLHQNKSETDRNMRGWLGTELTNKAFEAWSCSMVPNTETFKVEHVMSRMKRCQTNLYYQLDDNALPQACDKPDEQPREANGRFATKRTAETTKHGYKIDWATLNRDYILPHDGEEPMEAEAIPWDLGKLFADAMEGQAFRRFNQLMAIVMKITHIQDRPYYYHLLQRAQDEHYIAACTDSYGQRGFVLNNPQLRLQLIENDAAPPNAAPF